MTRPNLLLIPFLGCLVLQASAALAKSPPDYWQDTKDYFASPLRWEKHEWVVAGGVAVGIAAAYTLDNNVRDRVNPVGFPGTHPGSNRDAIPLAAILAGTFAIGALGDNDEMQHTGWDMGEAIMLTSLSTQALKFAFGRQRPRQTDSPFHWGRGGSSFPSGHTSVAFAAAQVLADELPREQWGWRVLAYSLAGATAYARMDSNAHWLSDTVAGAALGIATGRFVANRRREGDSRLSLSVAPTRRGAMMTFAIDTN